MDPVNRLLSEWLKWANEAAVSKRRRTRLKADVIRVFARQLKERDGYREIYARELEDASELRCSYSHPSLFFSQSPTGKSIVATIVPSWRHGWSDVSSDSEVGRWISDFFFFAYQYVARSRILPVIAGLALVYDLACDFRPGAAMFRKLRHDEVSNQKWLELLSDERTGAFRVEWPTSAGRRAREFVRWIEGINGLDPFIHRAAFQFWRAVRLRRSGFDMEAVVALHAVTSVACQYAMSRAGAKSRDDAMRRVLQTPESELQILDALRDARNQHAAHPTFKDWWDFEETYGDVITDWFFNVKLILWRVCGHENANRQVETNPDKWSDWLATNGDWLLRSTWP